MVEDREGTLVKERMGGVREEGVAENGERRHFYVSAKILVRIEI